MKIAIVLGHTLPFPPRKGGGIETINFALARQFAALGHNVTCYSRRYPNCPLVETDLHGIHHVRVGGADRVANLGLDVFYELLYVVRVLREMRSCDIVMLNVRWAFLCGWLIRKAIPVYTIQRTPKWTALLLGTLPRVYCPSRAVEVAARKIAPRLKNLRTIYNCVEIDSTTETPAVAGPVNDRRSLLFLFVGRFVRDKGLESLIAGFRESLCSEPANRLETLGPQTVNEGADPDFLREMIANVQEHSLGDKVAFLPPIYDKVALTTKMRSADVICVPTITGETFSSAVLEAMSLGKPVLVSDFGPMPEAVVDGETGKICRVGDAGSIAQGIEYLSHHRARLPAMGQAGRLKAQQEFSTERVANDYLADFHTLLAKQDD